MIPTSTRLDDKNFAVTHCKHIESLQLKNSLFSEYTHMQQIRNKHKEQHFDIKHFIFRYRHIHTYLHEHTTSYCTFVYIKTYIHLLTFS